ncbi:3-carboxy-cis,cis-muconate cycloisomerase [Enhydrobacter aerosaccus]|uniref:3-carboxy-cis,cis-muconate cycloisomerase n=1 Tax=Enhydrobacter aerosaccus TaxID=225324 RepID=A0A1T4T357_9HYPH|nr:lyase family protein [Enhydrobacter aerosaccus]SKA34925.1 3-carboxy-cis,cis-muconate cycloisomerase [Enhydrobacter aerosaccus]
MSGRLVNALNASTRVADAFSDEATLRHMLRFEAELARSVAAVGLVPRKHAATIVKACDPSLYDVAALVPVARRSMTLTVAVVSALTAEVRKRDEAAAGYVHWGATSQDVLDTAMVLQLQQAVPPLIADLHAIVAAFAALAKAHRKTLTMGRTLMQPATPLAFGQKVAGWASDIDRATRRLEESYAETQIVQFGGASGSLSALGKKAEPVMKNLAKGLGLELPPAPWFTQRVRVAAFAQDVALVVGALGKAAKDIALLMQYELQELSEPSGPGRGASSTMPHKRNPVAAGLVLTAAARAPQLAATIVAGMPQENERALGGWQAEWPSLAGLLEAFGSAVEAMAEAAPGLTIYADRMGANLEGTNGAVLAERATFLLAEKMGKDKAKLLVEQALSKGGNFVEALGRFEAELGDRDALLGYSPKFVDRLLAALGGRRPRRQQR